ncbi:MAG TPA: response regulator transcription factor [Acidimicrobiales bacterium]|nr:response regulator transcription factor [Acidimicrobiales bacterium]
MKSGSANRRRSAGARAAGPAPTEQPITVMVAVDIELFGCALAHSIDGWNGIEVVHHGAMGGADALEIFKRASPDVVLLTYELAGLDGPETTEAIRACSSAAKVLLLAGIYGPQQVERALSAGAAGFLPKSLSVSHVVESIRQAHLGRPLVYAEELADIVDGLNKRIRRGDDLYARYATLTERELEILRLLGEGKTSREVAADLFMSAGTLKNQLTKIFSKTGAASRVEAIETARRAGFIPERNPFEIGTNFVQTHHDVQPPEPQPPHLPAPQITVAVAHRQRLFAEGLVRALQHHPGLKVFRQWSTTGAQVIKEVGRLKPDVALIDFWIADVPGPAAVKAALQLSPATQVLFLTEFFIGPLQWNQARACGARWFVPKDFSFDQIVTAIRAAAADARPRTNEELPTAGGRRGLTTLSPREIEVLQVLSRGSSIRAAANELSISAGTVKNHVHNILEKTGARNQIEVLIIAKEEGLI